MPATISDSICFVGGVHGSGKSILCRDLAAALDADHLIASELIQYRSAADDPTRKAVTDLTGNQDRLLTALRMRVSTGRPILLDGHFSLLNSDGMISRIPTETFASIAPAAFLLIEVPVVELHRRLNERGDARFTDEQLEQLIVAEREHATSVAMALQLPLTTVSPPIDLAVMAAGLRVTLATGGRA